MDKTDFKNAFKLLNEAKSIAIVGHIRPDGDCIGCCSVMRQWFLSQKKRADVYIDGIIPETLNYIAGVGEFKTDIQNLNIADLPPYDLLLFVDTGDDKRIGECNILRQLSKRTLCIDHHLNNSVTCDTLVLNSDMASCGEIIYELLTQNNVKITKDMATALFTSVSSDTGCFLYPNTTSNTHMVAAALMTKGIDREMIMYYNFRVYDPKLIRGLLLVLKNIRFTSSGRIAITHLSNKFCRRYDFDHEERHKFQKYAIDAQGVRASVFLTESQPKQYHISLRSHGNINMAAVAEKYKGGGHKNAAGCTINGKYKNFIANLISNVEKAIDAEKNPSQGKSGTQTRKKIK